MSTLDAWQKTGKVIHLQDGRSLGYAEYGDPAGKPVFFFHGWPGSHLQRHPNDSIAFELGVRLITIDRPGYGLSAFKPGRKLLDWPDDVLELADTLGIDRFVAIGLSGGGPHLLACAYKIPQRLARAIVVSGLAPVNWQGATQGIDRSSRVAVALVKHAPEWLIRAALGPTVRKTAQDPEHAVKNIPASLPQADKDVFARPDMQVMDRADLVEAYRQGVRGVAQEISILLHPWGFRLEDIGVPVKLWHGEEDITVPLNMGKYTLRTIPQCEATFIAGQGHLVLFNYWQEILSQAVS